MSHHGGGFFVDMFKNRQEAGIKLSQKLDYLRGKNTFVLAIPRGGVAVGKEISQKLNCPLGILIVKKIGAPGNPELAAGAMGPDGKMVWNEDIMEQLGLTPDNLAPEIKNLKFKMRRSRLQPTMVAPTLRDKTVILTDDGIATGATIEVAIAWLRKKNPQKIVLAVPVAPKELVEKFKSLVDELIILETPEYFGAVGQFYEEFPQISDEEVVKLL